LLTGTGILLGVWGQVRANREAADASTQVINKLQSQVQTSNLIMSNQVTEAKDFRDRTETLLGKLEWQGKQSSAILITLTQQAEVAQRSLKTVERVVTHFDNFGIELFFNEPENSNFRRIAVPAFDDMLTNRLGELKVMNWPAPLKIGLRPGTGSEAQSFTMPLDEASIYGLARQTPKLKWQELTNGEFGFHYAKIKIAFAANPTNTTLLKGEFYRDLNQVDLSADSDVDATNSSLMYDGVSKSFLYKVEADGFNSANWQANGNFNSISDLGGSQVFVVLEDNFGNLSRPGSYLTSLIPSFMKLRIGNLYVTFTGFKQVGDLPVYSAILPSQEEILKKGTFKNWNLGTGGVFQY